MHAFTIDPWIHTYHYRNLSLCHMSHVLFQKYNVEDSTLK